MEWLAKFKKTKNVNDHADKDVYESGEEYTNPVQEIKGALNLVKAVVVIMAFLFWSVYSDLKELKEENRTVLMFAGTGQTAWVSGTDVSDTYAKLMMGFVITMWGNTNAATIDAQLGELLKLAHPYYLNELKEKFTTRANRLKQYNNVTLIMRPSHNQSNPIRKEVVTNHEYIRLDSPLYKMSYNTASSIQVGIESPSKNNDLKLEVYFTVDNGLASLVDIKEVIPHA